MKSKVIMGIMLTPLLIGMLTLAFNIQPVKARETIYIRADGSVDPPGVPISSVDNITYTLTADIYDSIVVERDNIIIDGAGYTVEGPAAEWGTFLPGRRNVTIRNMEIKAFTYGILLGDPAAAASNNVISGNNIKSNSYGICLQWSSNHNSIYGNNITNNGCGIYLNSSSNYNSIYGNNVTANTNRGIYLRISEYNSISGNNIANNGYGVELSESSSGNTISDNDITNNVVHGIYVINSSNYNSIYGNNITANGWEGIRLSGDFYSYGSPNYNSIYGNNITANVGGGIVFFWGPPAKHNSIYGNTVANNGYGISLRGSNNSISGNNITANFWGGIDLGYANYNSIVGNNITNNTYQGIRLGDSSNNTIFGNNITKNDDGIQIFWSSTDNIITGNKITTNNGNGVKLYQSIRNTVSGNNITTNNGYGIGIYLSYSPNIYHNNFINNTINAYLESSEGTVWDNGYPSGGNYWSDYAGNDTYRGPFQNMTGSDGIGDRPYIIDANNKDRYPFMTPLPHAREPAWDIAVSNVVPSKTVVIQGQSLNINVTVANQGTFNETFDVTLYADLYAGVGLAGYWKFDEGSGGAARDSSGNNNNGTISGATWTSGKIGNALQFDGTDDYVEVPHSGSLNPTNIGTITAWIKIPSVGTVNRGNIVNKGGGWNRRGWMLATIGYNKIRFHWQSGADKFIDSQTALAYNEWHHIAAVMDGMVMKIYIDGVQDQNTLLNTESADTTTPIRIGRTDYYGYLPFKGTIDEVRIYNRALNQEEITALATTERFTIQTQTVNLESGASTTITFTWNTRDVRHGDYTISAYATPVPCETDIDDNTYIAGTVTIQEKKPVGGIYIPVNKLQLLTPYIGLTILLVVAVVTLAYVKKRKRNTWTNS